MVEPPGILGRIVAVKRDELRSRFDGVSLDQLRQTAQPTRRSLAEAIGRPGARFILEIKKASPSGGQIRPYADAARIARGYGGVADALSVLVDANFFGGSLDDVAAARRSFDGPILAKDFFVDLRQVAEARLAGADAILVMLSVLDDTEAAAMIAEARRFGMDALVEVHDEQEMRRAMRLRAPLIGINNRDLRDLSVRLLTTERLAPMARNALVVSESGISARADVERLSGKVDGFLVGSALMHADQPALAAREMIVGRVKLCGLTRSEDFRAAAPATFAGLMFVPASPRCLSPEEAAPLAGEARRRGMLPVGIFRNAPVAEVADAVSILGLDAVQLHGREDVEYIASLRRQLPERCELWTAIDAAAGSLNARGGDRLLFDNGPGGSGRAFDWSRLQCHPGLAKGIVAGGIGPANARAAAKLSAYAIDVGSAVDVMPGLKSSAKIRELFENLRLECRRELRQCA